MGFYMKHIYLGLYILAFTLLYIGNTLAYLRTDCGNGISCPLQDDGYTNCCPAVGGCCFWDRHCCTDKTGRGQCCGWDEHCCETREGCCFLGSDGKEKLVSKGLGQKQATPILKK